MIKRIFNLIFVILVIKTLDPEPDPDHLKLDLDSMNPDPQHC
jgi:hypothetical protein